MATVISRPSAIANATPRQMRTRYNALVSLDSNVDAPGFSENSAKTCAETLQLLTRRERVIK